MVTLYCIGKIIRHFFKRLFETYAWYFSTLRYLYQGRLHQVVVGDSEGLRLPRNAHRMASSGTVTPPVNSAS